VTGKLPAVSHGSATGSVLSTALHRLVCLAACLTVLVALPATSAAAVMPGPSVFSTGLVDSPVFQDAPDSLHAPWFARARKIGSQWVRLNVYWSLIAPQTRPHGFQASNPGSAGYDWTALDASVREAAAQGQNVLMLVLAAPSWAQGPGGSPSAIEMGAWEPDPKALGAFAHAIALRYSGHFPDPLHRGQMLPLVNHFQAWNEPNVPIYIQPQWVRSSTGTILPASPEIYRGLLNSFYAAVKAVQPQSVVISAGTAPYGDPPGVNRMYPVVFLQNLFCLTPSLTPTACPDPPHLDALDHHPYAGSPVDKAKLPDDVIVPDLGKIERIVSAAQRFHHVLPAGPKPLWVTEMGWSSNPPNANAPSLTLQASYVSLAFYELWSQGVSHAFWYLLRDPLTVPDASTGASFFGGGLYFDDGVAKPAAASFRFPFVAIPVPHQKNLVTVWGRAPTAGTVMISRRVGGSWRRVLGLTTTPGGVFYSGLRLGRGVTVRAQIGGQTSQNWVTGTN